MSEIRPQDSLFEGTAPLPYRLAEGVRITARPLGRRGPQNYVVRAPAGDLVQLGEEEHFLLTTLDGRRSFDNIEREFRDRFSGELSHHHFRSFVEELQAAGVIARIEADATPAPEGKSAAALIALVDEAPAENIAGRDAGDGTAS